jgi:hypothetical protein
MGRTDGDEALTTRGVSRWQLTRCPEIGTMNGEAINPRAFRYFSRSMRLQPISLFKDPDDPLC